jgi:hypothetical protein
MFPIRHTHTLYGALILLSCVGQGAGLPAAGLRAYVRVAATTTITHMRPLWDNSLLRMSVCASLPEQRTDYKCALAVCGGLVTRTEVGLRTHVECGLPKVSRVLGLCVACPEPRSAGHQGTTSRQQPSSLAQPCGIGGFAGGLPLPTHTCRHTSVRDSSACADIICHVCASLSIRACVQAQARVPACAHLSSCVDTRASSHVHTNEPNRFWSRVQIMCARTRMSLL